MTFTARPVIYIGILMFCCSTLHAQDIDSIRQVDMIDYIVKIFKINSSDEKRDANKLHFSLFPTQSNATGGKVVISSVNASFLAGDKSNTNVSSIYFIPYLTFSKQYGFIIRPNIWLSRNSWNFTGEYFILKYPQYTWGLGGNSAKEKKSLIDYSHLRVRQDAVKKIVGYFGAGLGYALDNHYNIYAESNEDGNIVDEYPPGDKRNTVASGLTVPVIYDSRYNSINPQQGEYINLTWRFNNEAFGSDANWQSVFFDARKYFSFSSTRQKILAFRGYYWSVVNGDVAYLDLPSNGWEPIPGTSARGIQQNRYRSNALMDFECEYRIDITANGFLGLVFFANVVSASEYNTQDFKYWHPAGGTGIRVKFNKYSATNVTLDYGISKEFSTVYLNIGEVF